MSAIPPKADNAPKAFMSTRSSKSILVVPLLNPKFASEAPQVCENFGFAALEIYEGDLIDAARGRYRCTLTWP
jgi:hypothetical protein